MAKNFNAPNCLTTTKPSNIGCAIWPPRRAALRWLPRGAGFFPDFVAELLDGRIAVVEYKGAHLLNDPYEIEKRQVGELWARKSGGRCLFRQIVKDKSGVGIQGQIDVLLA